jgi:hypothetical protein
MRAIVVVLFFVGTAFESAPAAQDRKMAPIERHVLVGDYYLLEPFVGDLRQQ